jgi:hypothetical protein
MMLCVILFYMLHLQDDLILRCGAEAGALLVDGLGDGEKLPSSQPLLVSAVEYALSALNLGGRRAEHRDP